MTYSLRQKVGAVIHDLPGFIRAVRVAENGMADSWVLLCNRHERLVQDARRIGARCDWQWTSDLHVTNVFPWLGTILLKKATRRWPIALRDTVPSQAEKAQVSFIIGHHGRARLPQLLTTLRSIANQREVSFECIVVEQSETPEVAELMPHWVKYVHAPPEPSVSLFCRSAAFNVGASVARGEILVLHDNDLLVPHDYALEIVARYREGNEVINLKRFIFYLTNIHSQILYSAEEFTADEAPHSIMQNAQGGGSLAIGRDAYFSIGGFDESFVGWGGEDNEFWERAQTRSLWPYGYLPLVHLWHEPQPDKLNQGRHTSELYKERSRIRVEERIVELKAQRAPAHCKTSQTAN